jgi:predicted phage tail protein
MNALEHPLVLSGSGGGSAKGGGSGRAGTEAPDSLKSRSYANILLACSEGPIVGFTDSNPLKQIYLDDTPIVSASGNLNFKEVFWEFRNGTPDQTPTSFNLGKIRYETPVEAGVKNNSPVTRTLVDGEAEFIIIRVRLPSLFSSDDKGNINPTSITYRIEISTNNGPYLVVYRGDISGKTNSTYEESRAFALTPNAGNKWDIRLVRETPDSTSIKLQNDLIWASLQVNQKGEKSFPNVAVQSLRINSDQFSNIPTVGLYQRGLIVRVPHNYNSLTRTYSGSFNGSLVAGWTNNPAWILWAALTNERWGCGIPESQLDIWSFYDAARYNDELVPAGGGTFEPRYTFNAYLNSSQDAFDAVTQIAFIMRSQVWWNGSRIILTQDRPSSPVRQYSPANVIYEYDDEGVQTGGGFSYACTDVTTRYTSVVVKFIDPNTWQEDSVTVEDQDLINQWGFRQLILTAVGCISRSQAQRIAEWEFFTSTKQTDICTFKVASEGLLVNPGEVIYIQNPTESGETLSGRIVKATSNTIQLDFPIQFQQGLTYELITVKSNGTLQVNTFTSGNVTSNKLTLTGTFSEIPSPETPWMISKPGLVPELFQVVKVTDENDGTFTIESVNYDPSKYDYIERDIPLVERDTSNITVLLDPPLSPINIEVSESLLLDLTSTVYVKTQLIWGIPSNSRAVEYQVEYRKSGENDWITGGTALSTSFELRDLAAGDYEFRIASVSSVGRLSEWSYRSAKLFGLSNNPAAVTNVSISASRNQAQLRWDLSPDLDVKFGGQVVIRHSPSLVGATWSNSTDIGSVPGNATSAVVPLLAGTYLLKFVDSGGRESLSSTSILTTGIAILSQNVITSLTESPTYSGTKDSCYVENGLLRISLASSFVAADGLFTEAPGLFTELNVDKQGIVPEAIYNFANTFDAGRVISARIWSDLEIFTQANVSEVFTDRQGNFLEQLGLFAGGGDDAPGSAKIEIALSNDGINYTNWQRLIIGEYNFRYVKFRLVLESYSPIANIAVNRLAVNIDVPDVSQSNQVSVPYNTSTLGTRVNFPIAFIAAPTEVAAIISPLYEGETIQILNIDATGFNIKINYSGSVAPSTRTLNWFATSY